MCIQNTKKGEVCGKTLLAEVLYGSKLDKKKDLTLILFLHTGIMSDMSLKKDKDILLII